MKPETKAPAPARCRLCGATESTLVATTVFDAPASSVYRCGGCGVVYLFPIMSVVDEGGFYEKDFPYYMKNRNAPGETDAEAHFKANAGEAERRFQNVARWLQPSTRALEIGSATGFFLGRLRPHVASVTGVEPGTLYAEYAAQQGIEMVGAVKDLAGRTFDAIFAYFVLEHMRDPVRFLSDLGRLLSPGGRVFIEVPNVDDALISTYRVTAFDRFYWQRAHYYYYSRDTLTAVFARAGLRAEVLPEQRYDLSNHMHWMLTGKPGGKGTYRDLFTDALEAEYARCLEAQWICDTLFAVGSHPDTGAADRDSRAL